MCSIMASFSAEKLKELVDINQFRGNFSFSYTEVDEKNRPVVQVKSFGEFNKDIISPNNYKIAHVQAPTGGLVKDEARIHPVEDNGSMLWHNGLIVPRGIKYLQELLGTDETFDTRLLHRAILVHGFDILNDIEGLFSCLLIRNGNIFIFRTKHGKLYVDEDMNISSERFDGSKCINSDTIYNIDVSEKDITVTGAFKTKRFNYAIPGEL